MQETGLTMTEYGVSVALSEAPGHEQLLSCLAAATPLSVSRVSRVVGGMQKRGLVGRRPCPGDARSRFAIPGNHGMATLNAAHLGHLNSVCTRTFSTVPDEKIGAVAPAIVRIASFLRRREAKQLY